MKITLESLLHRLVVKGNDLANRTAIREDAPSPTTIRLKPATRHFLDAQSTALSTSVQSLISIILDGVAEASTDPVLGQLRAVRERFFLLLEAHRLDLPNAVELLKEHGFTLSALASTERLLDLMTTKVVQHLAGLFHVRAEWLDGRSDQVTRAGAQVRWYKGVRQMALQLIGHKNAGLDASLMAIRRQGADFRRAVVEGDAGPTEPLAVVLRLERRLTSGQILYTYQLWESERWNYPRCRHEFKLLVAFCEQMKIDVVGHELPANALDILINGRCLPALSFQALGAVSWHPDDYVGFSYTASQEGNEWPSVKEAYLKSGLPQLAMEAGAQALPEGPWAPTAS